MPYRAGLAVILSVLQPFFYWHGESRFLTWHTMIIDLTPAALVHLFSSKWRLFLNSYKRYLTPVALVWQNNLPKIDILPQWLHWFLLAAALEFWTLQQQNPSSYLSELKILSYPIISGEHIEYEMEYSSLHPLWRQHFRQGVGKETLNLELWTFGRERQLFVMILS